MVRHEIDGSHFTPTLEINEQFPHLPVAVEILRTHDTDQLISTVNGVADYAQNVDPQRINVVINHLKTAYTGKRNFVEESEINHALHVGLLVASYIGIDNLQTDTFAVALGHDYFEDTNFPLNHMGPPPIGESIKALSHTKNGQKIYSKDNKKPYFQGIIEADRVYPQIEIATIKVCDQFVVSNSPLTIDELRSPDVVTDWNELSRRKITEMNLFLNMLNDSGLADSRAAKILNVAIPFTEIKLSSHEPQIPLLKK